MIKVLTIFGTRPEAIKLAPVIKKIQQHSDKFVSKVCVTAQHRQMLDQVLNLFEITPDYDLDIMKPSQTLAELTAKVLTNLDPIIQKERPDWVLVQGDTTTVMVAALSAFYHQVKVGHIEAGLRTWDKHHPFPEEMNRKIATAICDMHFAPTEISKQNLLREGVLMSSIHVTGNTVIDALHLASAMPYNPLQGPLADLPWEKRLILVTAHRRESFGVSMEQICLALRDIAETYGNDVQLIFPVHLNPNVQQPVRRILGNLPNVTLTQPLEYLPLIYLMTRCVFVITDSGGIQEEAPGLGKPVLVLRDTTERPEAVDAGTVRLVGTDRDQILLWARRLLDDQNAYEKMARAVNPYGDGKASTRIVDLLLKHAGV